ncbi:unnamed protein product [Caenorhabditis nigoni]
MNVFFSALKNVADKTYARFDEMDENQKLANYEIINEYAQRLLEPTPQATDYKTMPYEKLKERYNSRMACDNFIEQYEYQGSNKYTAIKKLNGLQNMSNGMSVFFKAIVSIADETYDRFDEMNPDQKLANYKIIHDFTHRLLNPPPRAPNYETMAYQELIEQYIQEGSHFISK